ncbi:MAG: Rpn family recombination-promoting nuclease/putative transposase [Lachnospiraceae bacterium]|nr:Rpn family recombination-promoting nuclease/putative transposase [Lachnospiraceae bacterium]
MDITKEECYTRGRNIPYEKLTLANDFMFCKVMQNEKLCKELLEIILGIEIVKISYTEEQKIFKNTYDGKSIRLDVYVKDEKHSVYDIEMQTSDTYELPKRTRYYHSMIDRGQLTTGKSYNSLTESYVIFICTFDLFKKGIAKYSFESICSEYKDIYLEDGRHTIFINAGGVTDNRKLKEFLEYLRNGTVTNSPLIQELDDAVKYASMNSKWRKEYEMLIAREQDLIEEGRKAGLTEGLAKGLTKGLAEGYRALFRLVNNGNITLENALNSVKDKEDFQKWLDEQEK